jgi:hypothetical protein
MAVYEQTYKPYTGKLTPEWSRFLIIPRHAFRGVFKSKLFTAFYVVCFIPLLVEAVLIYLHHNVTALAIMRVNVRELLPIDGSFFQAFVNIQGGFAFFVALLVGPPLVSRDLRNNALPLYVGVVDPLVVDNLDTATADVSLSVVSGRLHVVQAEPMAGQCDRDWRHCLGASARVVVANCFRITEVAHRRQRGDVRDRVYSLSFRIRLYQHSFPNQVRRPRQSVCIDGSRDLRSVRDLQSGGRQIHSGRL